MDTQTEGRAHVNAFVDVEVRRELERLARVNDRSMSAEIRLALREYVERTHPNEEDET
jgi:predicted transcriptional regulator